MTDDSVYNIGSLWEQCLILSTFLWQLLAIQKKTVRSG